MEKNLVIILVALTSLVGAFPNAPKSDSTAVAAAVTKEVKNITRICTYRDQTFKVGDKMEVITTDNPCRVGCFCMENDFSPTGASTTCANVECAFIFGPPLGKDCIRLYEPHACCPRETKCPNDTKVAEPLCTYNNRTYIKGERIFPDEDPCISCTCVEGFKDLKSPSCRNYNVLCEPPKDPKCKPIPAQGVCCLSYDCGEDDKKTA